MPVIDWTAARTLEWDLVLLTTRPTDLDSAVIEAVRAIAPRWVLSTSQVAGDLELASSLLSGPGVEVLIAGPSFLSERVDDTQARTAGRDVRYWRPSPAPAFLVAGCASPLGAGPRQRLPRALGSFVLPVPLPVVLELPRVFIPFAAELSVRDGEWAELLGNLDRPTRAAAEAIGGLIATARDARPKGQRCRPPLLPGLARVILGALETVSPISMGDYAGRHFGRHRGQTRDMLTGWVHEAEGRGLDAGALRELSAALEGRARSAVEQGRRTQTRARERRVTAMPRA